MNSPTSFVDASAKTAREAEVPDASFDNGMNGGGSNAPGIGIATDVPDLTGDPASWTLLDQEGNPRTPQNSQQIGGDAYSDFANDYPLSGGQEGAGDEPVLVVETPADPDPIAGGDGTSTPLGNATLPDLATGWTAV